VSQGFTSENVVTPIVAHGTLTGLAGDDHTIYALLAGRNGGQVLIGGTASGDDLTLQSTSNAARGTVKITDIVTSTTERSFLVGTLESSHTLGALSAVMQIGGAISTASSFASGLIISNSFTGAGDHPLPFHLSATLDPSASITTARGMFVFPKFNSGASITIDRVTAIEFTYVTGAGSGAITTAQGMLIGGPAYGTLKPTTAIGITIANQGAAGIGTAIGIEIAAQSGATNNYDMSFGRVDLTAAGAYYGRIPILYNGLLKYIHVFSA
jgi:hypothetical protein